MTSKSQTTQKDNDTKYEFHRDKVIQDINKRLVEGNNEGWLPVPEHGPNIDVSADANAIWNAFKHDCQHGLSIFTDVCTEVTMDLCADYVGELPEHEVNLLWLSTDAFYNLDDDESDTMEQKYENVTSQLVEHVRSFVLERDYK
jgi:hypothetical protein